MKLATIIVVAWFVAVAVGSVVALVLLEEADAAQDDAWADCPDEVEP